MIDLYYFLLYFRSAPDSGTRVYTNFSHYHQVCQRVRRVDYFTCQVSFMRTESVALDKIPVSLIYVCVREEGNPE